MLLSDIRLIVAVVGTLCSGVSFAAHTEVIDVTASGTVASPSSTLRQAISADGRYVAFTSDAGNIVTGISSGPNRVYLRDTATNTTILASRNSQGGVPMVGSSVCGSISFDGRFVVFSSSEALTPNAPGGFVEAAYIFDRLSNSVELVSVSDAGIGKQGEFNPDTSAPRVTSNGRYVLFESKDDLVTGVVTPSNVYKVYRRDRVAQQTILVSPITLSNPASCLSGGIIEDGSRMLFRAIGINFASPTPGVYVRDLTLGFTQRIDVAPNGTNLVGVNGALDWTADGTRVVVATDTSSNASVGDVDASPDVYSIDWLVPAVTVISRQNDGQHTSAPSFRPSISDAGRYVVFESTGQGIASWDSNGSIYDIVLRDLVTQRNALMNLSSTGAQAIDADCNAAMISGDGTRVVFVSSATGLASGVTGFHYYLRDRIGFTNLGYGKPGASHAIPNLSGSGSTAPGGNGALSLAFAAPFAQAILFAALDRNTSIVTTGPLKSTVFVPLAPFLVVPVTTDGFGTVTLPYTMPVNVPLVPEVYLQYAIADPLAIGGVSVSNALLMGL